MLRFKKETDLERIARLKRSILGDYVDSSSSQELLVSEADLKFLVLKAEEQVNFEAESNTDEIEDVMPITNDFQSESNINKTGNTNESKKGGLF